MNARWDKNNQTVFALHPKNVISRNVAFLNANVLEACALEIQRSYETNMEKLKVCIVVFTSLSCIKPKTASPKINQELFCMIDSVFDDMVLACERTTLILDLFIKFYFPTGMLFCEIQQAG